MANLRIYDCTYALSDGVLLAELVSVEADGAARAKKPGFSLFRIRAGEWCETEDGALRICEAMRAKRIASLEKSIKRTRERKIKMPEVQP